MAAIGLLSPNQQFFSNAGAPLVGGKVYTYITGTSTPTNTYSDADLSVPNANPIILDGSGRAIIYCPPTPGIKLVVTNSADVTQWTQDMIAQATVAT